MSDLSPLTLPLTALDFSQLPDILHVAIRGFVAVVSAIVGYFVMGPVVRLLYRLAFQRPMSNTLASVAQIAAAVLVGILVYYFLPLGGGSGGGWLGGGGLGGNGKEGKELHRDVSDKVIKESVQKKLDGQDVLEIEMVAIDWYQQDGRYYLIRKKDTPRTFATAEEYRKHLSTLEEVKDYLKANAKRLQAVDILIYKNSPERDHPSVQDLVNLAEKLHLRTFRPPEYQDKLKSLK